jgi:integration host factor subunit beta
MSFEKVTKNNLIESVYHDIQTVEKRVIQNVVESVLSEIKESLKRGSILELRGFGTFEPRLRKGRERARNPKTGEHLSVPQHFVAAFRAGRDLRTSMWDLPIPGKAAGKPKK